MHYILSHLPESGGQLLITSLTHNKKIVASSSTDIVLSKVKLYTMTFAVKVTVITFQNNNANIINFQCINLL